MFSLREATQSSTGVNTVILPATRGLEVQWGANFHSISSPVGPMNPKRDLTGFQSVIPHSPGRTGDGNKAIITCWTSNLLGLGVCRLEPNETQGISAGLNSDGRGFSSQHGGQATSLQDGLLAKRPRSRSMMKVWGVRDIHKDAWGSTRTGGWCNARWW